MLEITCKCILSQHRSIENPPHYSFIVFSVIDDNDKIIEKLANCENCGRTHRVYEVSTSEVLDSSTHNLISKEDISSLLPEKVSSILDSYSCLLYQYEEAKYILDNCLWGKFIILSRDKNEETKMFEGKLLKFISFNNYSIDYWKSEH